MDRLTKPFVWIAALLFLGCIVLGCAIYFSQHSQKEPIVLYGNVDVRQVDISFRVYGKIVKMPFEEGDFVPKGSFMGSIDLEPYADEEKKALAHLEAEFFQWMNAKNIFARRKELIEEGGVSEEDFENAKTLQEVAEARVEAAKAALGVAKTNLRDTSAFAPADGIVLTRVKEPGTVVLQGEPIYTLSLVSPVWIRAYVPEPLLGVIYPGMEANILTDTKDGKVYTGKIGFISPVAEFTPKTVQTTELRTDLVYRIRVYADNPDFGLKQGMPVTVVLK